MFMKPDVGAPTIAVFPLLYPS
eukprot:COSAG06_NODE_20454_length_795_cov_1.301724_3_plen_21_part_01